MKTQGLGSGFRGMLGMAASLSLATPLLAQVPPPPPLPADSSTTQPIYPICKPPGPGEYLLLVVTKTVEVQNQVRQALPASAKSTVCNYLDDIVTRVSGFTTIDTANAWARYLSESAGLSAFVARPAETSATSATSPPTTSISQGAGASSRSPSSGHNTAASTKPVASSSASGSGTLAFNPKLLGTGYAVLVNYFNQPELAPQIQQLLKQNVGLVSYGQRPYLLALYTSDHIAANKVLQTLTERGFWAMVVDSRRVTLLKSAVNLPQSTSKD